MQTSEQINEIATGIGRGAGQGRPRQGDARRQRRQPLRELADVIDTVRPALIEHGIAVVQSPDMLADHRLVTLTTRLIHTSGQWIQGTACAPAPEPNAATNPVQMVGSAIRYLCRYGLEAMVGVAEESADDADAAPVQPGQVRSLGTVAATSGPGVVNAVQPQPVTADPVATAGEVFDGAGDGDAALGAALRDLAKIGATADEVTAAAQQGNDAVFALVRHKHQDAILDELARLNAKPEEFEAALQQQYGVPTMAGLTVARCRPPSPRCAPCRHREVSRERIHARQRNGQRRVVPARPAVGARTVSRTARRARQPDRRRAG